MISAHAPTVPTKTKTYVTKMPESYVPSVALDGDRKGQKYEAEIMLTFEGPKAGDEIAKEYEKLEAWVSSGHIQ